MKKLIIVVTFFMTVLSISSSVASAQTTYIFNSDLYLGSRGAEVANLQDWLIQNGFDIPSVRLGYSGKGYYGSQTRDAVAAFQRSVGLPPYGYFGQLTRGYLNSRGGYGSGSGSGSNSASLAVTSPNGGETWTKGTSQNITWTGAPGILNQTGDIRLLLPVPPCAEPNQPVRCLIGLPAPYLIASGVNLNVRSYTWDVGSVRNLDGRNPFTLPDGQYRVQICSTYSNVCDESNGYFTITSGATNDSVPVINGLDAPTSLDVGQTGTWTVRATDPQNSQLSYSVVWGDEGMSVPQGYSASPSQSFGQNASFTHSYSSPGTYTVRFTVRNNAGRTAETSATVRVTGSSSAGPLRITSPNGGEIWQKGTIQTITWTSPYYFRATTADLNLVPYQAPCPAGMYCALYIRPPHKIVSGISINQNSYRWNVGNVLPSNPVSSSFDQAPDGQYSIQICETGTDNCDTSDQIFTISSGNIGYPNPSWCPPGYICIPNR